MTEQLPRPIEPSEMQAGDRVRITRDLIVDDADSITVTDNNGFTYSQNLYSWTLLHRPEPPREVGSRWRDPETGAEYVKTDHGAATYVAYTQLETVGDWRLYPHRYDNDAAIAARLERIEP